MFSMYDFWLKFFNTYLSYFFSFLNTNKTTREVEVEPSRENITQYSLVNHQLSNRNYNH